MCVFTVAPVINCKLQNELIDVAGIMGLTWSNVLRSEVTLDAVHWCMRDDPSSFLEGKTQCEAIWQSFDYAEPRLIWIFSRFNRTSFSGIFKLVEIIGERHSRLFFCQGKG